MTTSKYERQNALGIYIKTRKWTDLTEMCYSRGCRCKGCDYARYGESFDRCQVKASVLENVRVLGIPFERENVILPEVVKVSESER